MNQLNHLSIKSILCVFMSLTLMSFARMKEKPKTPQTALENYIKATNSHNFDNVLALLDTAAVFWFQDKEYIGNKQIRPYFEGTWEKLPDEKYSIQNVTWLFTEKTVATCLFEYSYQGTYNGKSIAGRGKGTNVFRKTKGEWLLIHEHLTPLK